MNSEKAKEIKEKLKEHYYYLDQAYSDYLAYGGKADEQQEEKIHFFGDILTLINELESKNEKFVESCKNCHYIKDLEIANGHAQELKDRIVELERENALIKNSVAMRGYKTLEEISNNKVKQFAEKLKNKLFDFFQDNEELDGKISVGPLYVDVIGVEAKDGTIISLGIIDELLKEYEK